MSQSIVTTYTGQIRHEGQYVSRGILIEPEGDEIALTLDDVDETEALQVVRRVLGFLQGT